MIDSDMLTLPLGSCAGAARGQGYPSGTVAEHCWHDLQQLVIKEIWMVDSDMLTLPLGLSTGAACGQGYPSGR